MKNKNFLSQYKKTKKTTTPKENLSSGDHEDLHKRLGCVFYALAILYYVIQVVRELGINFKLPHDMSLSSFLTIDPIVWISQILIIMLMLKRK